MKTITALIFACCFALTTFSQQLTLNGSLIEDSDKGKRPVPATRISVHGIENTTDPEGQFKLVLPSGFSEGELVIIKVVKPNCVINHPLDGKWNLPNIKLQNIQMLKVIIVSKGSWALLSEERRAFLLSKFKDQFTDKIGALTRQNVALRSELAASQTEVQALRTEVLNNLLNQWQQEYGLSVEGIKAVLDKYASTRSNSDDNRTKGLKAYYNGDFKEADAYFGKAGLEDEEDIKQIEEELERKKLSAFNNWKDQGESRSSSYNFREAINSYDRAAKFVTREKRPQEWAEIELLGGNARAELGIRAEGEEGRKLLKEAGQHYQNAFAVYTREELPQDWAITQHNLGNVLRNQSERTEGAEGARLLAEAVTAYRNALSVRTREQLPQDWAMTQNNLGVALLRQGERTEGAEGAHLLAEAVTAYHDALSVYTREQFPQHWAATQENLGNALLRQGERTEGAEGARLLAEAVTAYRNTLSARTREQSPQHWATTQNYLGRALLKQSERSQGADRERLLRESVNAFQLALQVRDRHYLPLVWAQTQNNLADAYYALRDWSNAADCYANVLTFYPRYKQGFQRASYLYHEILFRFDAAFDLKWRWLEANPNDLSILPDLAENQFTTGHFAVCGGLITVLLDQPEHPVGTKSALRLIEIANLLAFGQAAEVPAKLDLLIEAVAAQPADFKITWTFNGTLHFIGQSEKLAARRDWLKLLFSAADDANREAVLKTLREAKASFKP